MSACLLVGLPCNMYLWGRGHLLSRRPTQQDSPSTRHLGRKRPAWEAFTFSNGVFRRAAAPPAGPGDANHNSGHGKAGSDEPARPWAGTGEAVLPPPGM